MVTGSVKNALDNNNKNYYNPNAKNNQKIDNYAEDAEEDLDDFLNAQQAGFAGMFSAMLSSMSIIDFTWGDPDFFLDICQQIGETIDESFLKPLNKITDLSQNKQFVSNVDNFVKSTGIKDVQNTTQKVLKNFKMPELKSTSNFNNYSKLIDDSYKYGKQNLPVEANQEFKNKFDQIEFNKLREQAEIARKPQFDKFENWMNKSILGDKGVTVGFDAFDAQSTRFIQEYNYASLKKLSDDSIRGIRGSMIEGMSQGKSSYQIYKDLLPNLSKSSMPIYRKSDLADVEAGIKQIQDIKPLRWMKPENRAYMIARTEMQRAYNQGNHSRYMDLGIQRVKSRSLIGECNICATIIAEMPEEGWPIDESPAWPVHPFCRHPTIPIVDLKGLAERMGIRKVDNLDNIYPAYMRTANIPDINLGKGFPQKSLNNITDLLNSLPDHLKTNNFFSEGFIELGSSNKKVGNTHYVISRKLSSSAKESKVLEFYSSYYYELYSPHFPDISKADFSRYMRMYIQNNKKLDKKISKIFDDFVFRKTSKQVIYKPVKPIIASEALNFSDSNFYKKFVIENTDIKIHKESAQIMEKLGQDAKIYRLDSKSLKGEVASIINDERVDEALEDLYFNIFKGDVAFVNYKGIDLLYAVGDSDTLFNAIKTIDQIPSSYSKNIGTLMLADGDLMGAKGYTNAFTNKSENIVILGKRYSDNLNVMQHEFLHQYVNEILENSKYSTGNNDFVKLIQKEIGEEKDILKHGDFLYPSTEALEHGLWFEEITESLNQLIIDPLDFCKKYPLRCSYFIKDKKFMLPSSNDYNFNLFKKTDLTKLKNNLDGFESLIKKYNPSGETISKAKIIDKNLPVNYSKLPKRLKHEPVEDAVSWLDPKPQKLVRELIEENSFKGLTKKDMDNILEYHIGNQASRKGGMGLNSKIRKGSKLSKTEQDIVKTIDKTLSMNKTETGFYVVRGTTRDHINIHDLKVGDVIPNKGTYQSASFDGAWASNFGDGTLLMIEVPPNTNYMLINSLAENTKLGTKLKTFENEIIFGNIDYKVTKIDGDIVTVKLIPAEKPVKYVKMVENSKLDINNKKFVDDVNANLKNIYGKDYKPITTKELQKQIDQFNKGKSMPVLNNDIFEKWSGITFEQNAIKNGFLKPPEDTKKLINLNDNIGFNKDVEFFNQKMLQSKVGKNNYPDWMVESKIIDDAEDLKIVKYYQSNDGAVKINGFLSNDEIILRHELNTRKALNEVRKDIQTLRKTINANETLEDMIVYKGIDANRLGKYKLGEVVDFDSGRFISTSVDKGVVDLFGDTIVKFEVPKGTHYLSLNHNRALGFNIEQEILFNPSKVKFISEKFVDGKLEITARLIEESAPPLRYAKFPDSVKKTNDIIFNNKVINPSAIKAHKKTAKNWINKLDEAATQSKVLKHDDIEIIRLNKTNARIKINDEIINIPKADFNNNKFIKTIEDKITTKVPDAPIVKSTDKISKPTSKTNLLHPNAPDIEKMRKIEIKIGKSNKTIEGKEYIDHQKIIWDNEYLDYTKSELYTMQATNGMFTYDMLIKRFKGKPLNEFENAFIENLSNAAYKHGIKETTLYRGTELIGDGVPLKNVKVGEEFDIKNFESFTSDFKVADGYGETILILEDTKGAKGFSMNEINNALNLEYKPYLKEVILSDKTKIEITKIDGNKVHAKLIKENKLIDTIKKQIPKEETVKKSNKVIEKIDLSNLPKPQYADPPTPKQIKEFSKEIEDYISKNETIINDIKFEAVGSSSVRVKYKGTEQIWQPDYETFKEAVKGWDKSITEEAKKVLAKKNADKAIRAKVTQIEPFNKIKRNTPLDYETKDFEHTINVLSEDKPILKNFEYKMYGKMDEPFIIDEKNKIISFSKEHFTHDTSLSGEKTKIEAGLDWGDGNKTIKRYTQEFEKEIDKITKNFDGKIRKKIPEIYKPDLKKLSKELDGDIIKISKTSKAPKNIHEFIPNKLISNNENILEIKYRDGLSIFDLHGENDINKANFYNRLRKEWNELPKAVRDKNKSITLYYFNDVSMGIEGANVKGNIHLMLNPHMKKETLIHEASHKWIDEVIGDNKVNKEFKKIMDNEKFKEVLYEFNESVTKTGNYYEEATESLAQLILDPEEFEILHPERYDYFIKKYKLKLDK